METLYLLIIGVLILLVLISFFRFIRPTGIEPLKKSTVNRQQDIFDQELAGDITTFPVWEKKAPAPDPILPSAYHRDTLVLMVRDHRWLYSYWELTAEKIQQHPALQNTRLLLRLYDITMVENFDGTNAHWYRDIIIPAHANHWDIEVNGADRSYCVDLGYIINGRFITLLRSNTVTSPRIKVSDLVDEEWLPIEALYHSTNRFVSSSDSLCK